MSVPDPQASASARPEAPEISVHLALLSAQLFFGGFHVVAKAVLGSLEPLALAGIRVAVATPLMVLLAWRHDRFLPARRDLPLLLLLGVLGVFANQILFIVGLRYTTAINAAILMPSMPVFAVAAGALLGVERIGSRRLLGIALSVAGALMLVNPLRLSGGVGGQALLGNVLILINCCCYAVFLVLQRPLLRRMPWRTLLAASFVFGGTATFLTSLPALSRLDAAAVPATTWWGVAYIVVFATVVAYAINTWAVRRSSPSLVAAYGTLQPLVAAVLAASFLGERFGWAEGLGFGLIVAGLWQVSRRRGGPPGNTAT